MNTKLRYTDATSITYFHFGGIAGIATQDYFEDYGIEIGRNLALKTAKYRTRYL